MFNWQIDQEKMWTTFPGSSEPFALSREEVANFFHIFFWARMYEPQVVQQQYNGVPIHKNPCDLFNYQQIIFEQQPDWIIECGAFQGGATLYFANLLDLVGKGRVISVDICERDGVWHEKVRQHPRVNCVAGSSTDQAIVAQVHELVGKSRNNFVILDSLHTKAHVLDELIAYNGLVGSGNYLIVEDSDLNGHPIPANWNLQTAQEGGPFEAIEEFLHGRDDFRIDTAMGNRFLFSFAPSGYLVKQ